MSARVACLSALLDSNSPCRAITTDALEQERELNLMGNMYGSYLYGVDMALGATPGIFGFEQSSSRVLARSTAGMQSIWYRYGETNRYSKEQDNPTPVDSIPILVPGVIREAPHHEYKHRSVNSAHKEVRLLELLPKRWSKSKDFIACRLVTRRLDGTAGLGYEALSYCWGRATRDIPIFVIPNPLPERGKADEALLVTPQVYAILRSLRLETASRYLWIDQLCIDQTNVLEKGSQVLLMGDIYSRSKSTIIWLGEEDGSRAPIECFLRIAFQNNMSNQIDFASVSTHLQAKSESAGQLAAFTEMLNREWFTRAWTFQEAVLGNNVSVRCGGLELSFDALERITDAVKTYQYDKGGYARSIMKSTVGCSTIELIHHARTPNSCADEDCILFRKPDLLQTLFEASHRFRATDDADLIYAFLSTRFQNLSPGNMINPDYSQPIEWVWIDAARRIVAESKSLDILAAARGGKAAKYPSLPSWVPDWSDCFRFARPMYAPDIRSSFDACRGRQHVSVETESHFQLPVRGKIIRTISWTSPFNFEGTYYRDGLAVFLGVNQHVNDVRLHLGLQRQLPEAQVKQRWPDLRSSVIRTLLADGAFGFTQPLEVHTSELERIMASETEIVEKKKLIDRGVPVQNINRWQQDYAILEKLWAWGLIAQMKVLFTTAGADGKTSSALEIDLGLAATAVQAGDFVAILHGSRVPIALRRSEMGWKVISQCYLDGWMYGENKSHLWKEEEEADTFLLI